MKDLETHSEAINKAKNINEAFAYFCKVMGEYGYDRVVYSLLTDHHSLGLPRHHGLATSYPEDWMKYYNEKNYLDYDPVAKQVLNSHVPFFWEDLEQFQSLSDTAKLIMDQGSEAGVKDGIGIPLFGRAGEITGVGLARTDSDKSRDYDFMAGAYLLTTHFHHKFRTLYMEEHPANQPSLTEREADVLSWAAEGKNNEEIAIILGISVDTVKSHLKKCFRKLDVNNRGYAISKAVLLGLIMPNRIMGAHHPNG